MDGIAAPAGRGIDPADLAFPGSERILVGRTREQAALRDELAVAIGGRGRLVLVGGEAGIGKTALARDLIDAADDLGCRVLAGSCYDLTNTPPYGPWLDLFEGCRRDPSLPAPPAAFADGRLAPVTDQAALFAEVRRFLSELAAARPALVLLEDLHWADPASLELLRHVAPHVRRGPVLLLVTYRADELTRRHPLARQLPALVRESEGLRLDLRRLDQDGLHALVAAMYRLATADEARLVSYLDEHAEGNPFFAAELLRALEENGRLRPGDERWDLGDLDDVVVPTFLRQVIEGRVARLGEDVRKPLAMAAVIGQDIPLALWSKVADLGDEALLSIVEQAVDAHLLEAKPDGTRVRFVHALTREALYEGILPPRRRLWHRQVAETLMANAEPDLEAVAAHLQQARDPRAWEWLVQAADRAQRAYALLTAVERLRAAADLLAGVTGRERTRGWLLYRLADLKRFSDPVGAIDFLGEIDRLATLADDRGLAAELRVIHGLLFCYSDQMRNGLSTMVEGIAAREALALDVATSPDAFWGRLAHSIAGTMSRATTQDELAATRLQSAGLDVLRCVPVWFLGVGGQPRAAVAAGDRFLAVLALGPGTTEGARYASAFADHGLAFAWAALGQPDDARRAWARSRGIFRDVGHHVLVAFSLFAELWDRVYPFAATQPPLRRRYAAEAEAALARAGGALPPGLSPRLAWLSCFALDGRWEEALAILQDVPTPGNNCLRREISGPHATIARHQGDLETAWERIHPLFPAGPATEPGDLIHQEGLFLQRLAADLCLDAGDFPSARAWLDAHDRWLAWSESVLGQADGRMAWARWHRAFGDISMARSAAREALAQAETPRQPLVCLAGHRLLGEIETQARRHAEGEAHLTLALELAIACEAPFERALTLLALGELQLAKRDTQETARILDDVHAICAPLGAKPTLARADALAERLAAMLQTGINTAGLTPRELDVLRLVVAGRSNPEIAEELFISRDTARTHVANIFRKLDVGTRAEAVDYAHRHGLLSFVPPAST